MASWRHAARSPSPSRTARECPAQQHNAFSWRLQSFARHRPQSPAYLPSIRGLLVSASGSLFARQEPTSVTGRGTDARERLAERSDRDHGRGFLRAPARVDERRALQARGHLGRVDHRAHWDQGAACGRARPGCQRSRPPRGAAGACRRRPRCRRHRSRRRGHGHAGHVLSLYRFAAGLGARCGRRRRLRPVGGLYGLHVRARAGLRRPGRGARGERSGRRHGDALQDRELARPHDLRSLRGRRRGRRAAARPQRRLPRIRARLRRRRREGALDPGRRLTPSGLA